MVIFAGEGHMKLARNLKPLSMQQKMYKIDTKVYVSNAFVMICVKFHHWPKGIDN